MRKIFIVIFFILNLNIFSDTYKVVINHAPPYRIINNQEEYTGIYIDILKEVAKITDINLEFREVPFRRALEEMKEGRVDIMLGPNKTAEREEFMTFLEEYPFPKEAKVFYYKSKENNIEKYEDLYGKKIEILNGARYFDRFDNDFLLEKYSGSNYIHSIRKVLADRSQIVIIPELQGDYLLKEYGLRLFKSDFKIEGELSFIAISKRSPSYIVLKNKLIEGLKIFYGEK